MSAKRKIAAMVGVLILIELVAWFNLAEAYSWWVRTPILAWGSAAAFVLLLLGSIATLSFRLSPRYRKLLLWGGAILFCQQGLTNILLFSSWEPMASPQRWSASSLLCCPRRQPCG